MLVLGAFAGRAESGLDAWLRYEPIQDNAVLELYKQLPATVVRLGNSSAAISAQDELVRGIRGMVGRTLRKAEVPVPENMIVLGTVAEVKQVFPRISPAPGLREDGYALKALSSQGKQILLITAPEDAGVLHGVFAFLRHVALHNSISQIDERESPYAPIRWVNQWDNLDGSIERGYGGRSLFFSDNNVLPELTRVSDYARLLASIGINGCTINNVNANSRVLSPDFLPQLVRVAEAFRPWGVRISISVPFSSPKTAGELGTFDPLDTRVAAWWKEKTDAIYKAIPDFGGFLVKADSEGQLGPSTYGRSHADAANVLARALRPHGGVLIYRGFVYYHHLDWRNPKNDRAKAAYDNFHELDGKFDDNAAVQIKYGPIDFQVREPVSTLWAGLEHTNETLELQITQEYTGQQRHLCYLVPMWKEVLDFDLHVGGRSTPVREIASGKAFHKPLGGLVGVANVGLDSNWLGYDLAVANLYGFGRLAWNPELSAQNITDEWTRMTWGHDVRVVDTIMSLELKSWSTYESYTGPLGLGTLTDILHGHYGPGIETAERNGWGQWIRADRREIGMDRTTATGTGYIGQYPPEVTSMYESLKTTPDNLLLFMHHVPYTYVLHSGKTVIQQIYDSHYEGAAEAEQFPLRWETLRGRIDEDRYRAVLSKLEYQAGHAIVWRDAICNWFLRESGIPDEKGRAGHFSNRVEAESMELNGYSAVDVKPFEDASGGRAVSCTASAKECSAVFTYTGHPGWYNIAIQYFDENNGSAHFQVFVGRQRIQEWTADANLPANIPNGDTSTRQTIKNVALRPDDQIRILGRPGGGDTACLDYVEIFRVQ